MDAQNEALNRYITEQRGMGVSNEALYHHLISNGWPATVIDPLLRPSTPNMVPAYSKTERPNGYPTTATGGLFKGRIGRAGFMLGSIYPFLPLLLAAMLTITFRESRVIDILALIVGITFVLLMIPITVALHIKRWHDLDQSGWLTILGFVPFVGLILSILLLIQPGKQAVNKYGPPHDGSLAPKAIYGLGQRSGL